jgi:hypothetical protein
MAFPQSTQEMEAFGYKKLNSIPCADCGAPLVYWRTPNGKRIPMNEGTATGHWGTCPTPKFKKLGKGKQ